MMYTSHLLLLLLLFGGGNKRKKKKKKRHTLGRTSPDEQTRTSKRFSWDEQARANKPRDEKARYREDVTSQHGYLPARTLNP